MSVFSRHKTPRKDSSYHDVSLTVGVYRHDGCETLVCGNRWCNGCDKPQLWVKVPDGKRQLMATTQLGINPVIDECCRDHAHIFMTDEDWVELQSAMWW